MANIGTELPFVRYKDRKWHCDRMLGEFRCIDWEKEDLIFCSFDTAMGRILLEKLEAKEVE